MAQAHTRQRRAVKPPFRQALARGLRFRCPNCGLGEIFRGWMRMNESCAICGLSFYPESGYYTGAMYLDYMLSVLVVLLVWLPTLFLREPGPLASLSWVARALVWIGFGVLLCVALARPSYSLWLNVDFWITPWEPRGDSQR
jgi:uncharacterized protein (DUF983 family)